MTSLEPDVSIRIIPEATRSSYFSSAASKSGGERVKSVPSVRSEEVQTAHVAVFATACNARPRSGNDQENEIDKNGEDNLIDIDIDKLNDPGSK